MRALLGAMVAGTIVVACSSFRESAPETSAGADASTESESGSEVDAGVDTSDAATGPFCQGPQVATAFCASFDEGNPASFDWDGPPLESNAPVSVVEGKPGTPSPPGALRVVVPKSADSCFAQGQISKTFVQTAAFTKAHAEFMVKVDAVGVRFTYARLVTKPSPDAVTAWDLSLLHNPNPASDFGEQWTPLMGPTVSLGQGPAFSRYLLPGKWTKVAVDLTFDPPHFEVFFDGVSVGSRDSAVATTAFSPLSATLTIGVQSGDCPGDIDVSFDNVKFSIE